MRRMLGVLRQQDVTASPARSDPAAGQPPPGGGQAAAGSGQVGQAPLAPAPGLGGLDKLIGRTRGAGVRVTQEVAGRARPAPAGVDLSAYRIIQEALTNVVKHAGRGATCVVSVCYTDADLVIRVTDDGGLPAVFPQASVAAAGTGHGLIGMRERVHICGGTFSAGPLPSGGFQVTATLPLPAAGYRAEVGFPAEAGFRAEGRAAPAAVLLPEDALPAESATAASRTAPSMKPSVKDNGRAVTGAAAGGGGVQG
jgi:hypothetical protein